MKAKKVAKTKRALVHTGIILALTGFMLTLGAIGGLERETCTWTQCFKILAVSMPTGLIGVALTEICSWKA